jgi:hypothetical protein
MQAIAKMLFLGVLAVMIFTDQASANYGATSMKPNPYGNSFKAAASKLKYKAKGSYAKKYPAVKKGYGKIPAKPKYRKKHRHTATTSKHYASPTSNPPVYVTTATAYVTTATAVYSTSMPPPPSTYATPVTTPTPNYDANTGYTPIASSGNPGGSIIPSSATSISSTLLLLLSLLAGFVLIF